MDMNSPLKCKKVSCVSVPLIITSLVIAGCSKTQMAPAPPEVQVVQVQQKDVPIYSEWIGTLEGMVNDEIKAQETDLSRLHLIKPTRPCQG